MLEELRALVPPPPQPCFAEGDWEAVEKAIGTPLPGDYKRFIRSGQARRVGSIRRVSASRKPANDAAMTANCCRLSHFDFVERPSASRQADGVDALAGRPGAKETAMADSESGALATVDLTETGHPVATIYT